MMTLALLTLLLIMNGSAVGQMMKSKEKGFVGQDVLLPCNCSNDLDELIWKKDQRVVNVHPHNKSIIDESYINRTQLFLNKQKRNCSLLLLNFSSADAGLYTCHALVSIGDKVWSRQSSEVYLTDGSAVGQMMKSNVAGFVGQDVLLPCNCSNNLKELVWQRDLRVVNFHSHEISKIDDAYVDRTQLFLNKEKRNCSLLLIKVSSEDAGLYTCCAIARVGDAWSSKTSTVYLTVSENRVPAEDLIQMAKELSTYAPNVSKPLGVPTTHFPEVDQGLHRLRICSVK
ncbi:uncharacterized protein LOC113053078 [Carassius auratus]|uniref:Uncharacterized protein LOC113053078 n=1 Tax=Carassius auratus TaxID=7957 RepID=A0A6P6KML6_CARAU|nr:uncharacterized protein LOC113053078 [Carassius auratus]